VRANTGNAQSKLGWKKFKKLVSGFNTYLQYSQIARKSNIFDTSVYHSKNANMVKPSFWNEGDKMKMDNLQPSLGVQTRPLNAVQRLNGNRCSYATFKT
jgi:hypothetical protein